MPRAKRVCSTPGCATLTASGESRCQECRARAEKDRRPSGNPYSSAGHRAFRAEVLARDVLCVLCEVRLATVADHYPLERRELVLRHMDPNDPEYGRGLCAGCHNSKTARTAPGGWAAG